MPTPCLNVLDHLFTGLGPLGTNWTTDAYSYLFSGLGPSGTDWTNDLTSYFYTGIGDTTDWCNGGRIIASPDGLLYVTVSVPSVNYKAVIDIKSYKAVVNPDGYRINSPL